MQPATRLRMQSKANEQMRTVLHINPKAMHKLIQQQVQLQVHQLLPKLTTATAEQQQQLLITRCVRQKYLTDALSRS